MTKKLISLVLVTSLFTGFCGFAYAADSTAEAAAMAAAEQAQAVAPEKIAAYANAMEATRARAYQNVNSSQVQQQLQQIKGYNALPTMTQNNAQNPEVATSGDVLIFVSFSMPENSLKQWFVQAQHVQAPLIVRGLVNGSLKQTQKKMQALWAGNGSVVLEPRLFTDYGIKHVPAVVVRNTAIRCPALQNCPHIYPFDVVAGDVGLDYALATIARADGAASGVARAALQATKNANAAVENRSAT